MTKKRFRYLELKARKIVNLYGDGSHLSSLLDNYDDIHSIKQFQSGDKRLDIKNSIKYKETLAKTFEPEKQVDVYIVLDVSNSQSVKNKLEISILTSLYIIFLAEISYDNVGLLIFGNRCSYYPPSTHYASLLDGLSDICVQGQSDFNRAINVLCNQNPNNSLIFLISDFHFDISNKCNHMMRSMAANNKVFTLIINEDNINYGKCMVVDSETGESLDMDTSCINYSDKQNSIIKLFKNLNFQPILIQCSDDNPLMPLIRKLL